MIGGWRRRGARKQESGDRGAARPAIDGTDAPDPPPGGRPGAPPERLTVDYTRHPEASRAAIERLLEEYGRYVDDGHAICVECPVTCSGVFVVRSMLEWKAIHGDGRLDRWTSADVRKYGKHMHGRLARQTPADVRLLDTLLDTPTCVRDLIYFLSDRGTPTDDPDALADAADDIIGDLVVTRGDPASPGLAEVTRLMGTAMADPGERNGALVAGRAPQPAPQKATRAPAAKRRKRKAARAARKRNRG